MKSINVEGGFSICGGWNFSKLVSVDSTFIRDESFPMVYLCIRSDTMKPKLLGIQI